MLILATSDVHAPKHLAEFKRSVESIDHVDLALLAGDMVDGGRIEYYRVIIDMLKDKAGQVIAVPGNEEYDEKLRALKSISGMRLLNDEEYVVYGVRVIGSRGVLDKPTKWQERNVRDIRDVYENRLKWLISKITNAENTILVTHYSPTYLTLRGEDESTYPYLGTSRLEESLAASNILAIHGHAHGSVARCVKVGGSTIINVAFENANSVFIIRYDGSTVELVKPAEYSKCVEIELKAKHHTTQRTLDEWLRGTF